VTAAYLRIMRSNGAKPGSRSDLKTGALAAGDDLADDGAS
jgi:hypothetical protein